MTAPGRTHTFLLSPLDIPEMETSITTIAPAASVVRVTSTGGLITEQAEQSLVPLPGTANVYTLLFPVPDDAELETFFMLGSMEVGSVLREFAKPVTIGVDALSSAAIVGADISSVGGLLLHRMNNLYRDFRRALDRVLAQVDPVEVTGVTAIFSTKIVYRNDTPTFLFQIFDDVARTAEDLTGATVTFRARQEPSLPLIFEKTCSITDALAGRCEATLTSLDTATAGLYKAEVEVVFADATRLTAVQFNLNILEDVG